ncbi:hypothetical protein [Streptomyces sp. 4F14]
MPRERVDPSGFSVGVRSSTPVGEGVDSVHVQYTFPDAGCGWTRC